MLPAQSISIDHVSSFFNGDVDVDVLRLDKMHPIISGNKWFKLRFYLEEALRSGKRGILTYGGAWSNHIVATAAACREAGLRSIGIIRGEEPAALSNTLTLAKGLGMQLEFVSRTAFREKQQPASV